MFNLIIVPMFDQKAVVKRKKSFSELIVIQRTDLCDDYNYNYKFVIFLRTLLRGSTSVMLHIINDYKWS